MSYKNNLKNPNRRKEILSRRETGVFPKIPFDALKKPVAYYRAGTPMKLSNRNAVMRHLVKYKELFSKKELEGLYNTIRNGMINRQTLLNIVKEKSNVNS